MIFTLEAEKRTTTKKSEINALRSAGKIPAIMYGKDVPSTPIALNSGAFMQCFKKSFNELAFYEILLEGNKYHTILKDKLVHPVHRNILHLDFLVVPAKAHMEFDIPVRFMGEAIGNKEGGFTDVIQRTVKISCLAEDVPEEIDLDVSGLHVGESLHVKDLPTGKWTYKDNPEVTLVVVHAKKVETAAPTAVTPEPAPETKEETTS
jgi:large subunit ribosomal protein L25